MSVGKALFSFTQDPLGLWSLKQLIMYSTFWFQGKTGKSVPLGSSVFHWLGIQVNLYN